MWLDEPEPVIRRIPWPNGAKVAVSIALILEAWQKLPPVSTALTPVFPKEAIDRGLTDHATLSWQLFGGRSGFAYATRIGHPVEQRGQLALTSPVNQVADVTAPMLLFHGRQDACVPVSHLTAFSDSLRRAAKEHTVILYEDEGHAYVRPQNVADFRLRTLEFLHGHLCGSGEAAS